MTESSPQSKLAHPCFPQPSDGSVKVWRYLDLPKFIWMLSSKKLYLPRLDFLSDPHEGSTPRLLAAARDTHLREVMKNAPSVDMSNVMKGLRRALYVSCWHLGPEESEAMWRLYCPGTHGVAIQTTYASLVSSLEPHNDVYIGRVTYIDYESQFFPANNLFYPVMHKRLSFSHESEVRLVKMMGDHIGTAVPMNSPHGIEIDWSIEKNVTAVYVNPYAPEYFRDAVCSVLRAMAPEIESRLQWSKMRSEPVY